MKRLFSLIAVAVLCFLLCVPAFATDAEIPPAPEFSDEMKSLIAEHDLKVLLGYARPSGDRLRFSCFLFPSSEELCVVPSQAEGETYRIFSRSSSGLGTVSAGVYRYYLDTGAWEVDDAYLRSFDYIYLQDFFCIIPEVSTVTLYNEDGTVFFRPALPLAEQLQAQAGELTQTQVTETLNFLVPLGIGLMALLISSVLLRRVFRTFL